MREVQSGNLKDHRGVDLSPFEKPFKSFRSGLTQIPWHGGRDSFGPVRRTLERDDGGPHRETMAAACPVNDAGKPDVTSVTTVTEVSSPNAVHRSTTTTSRVCTKQRPYNFPFSFIYLSASGPRARIDLATVLRA